MRYRRAVFAVGYPSTAATSRPSHMWLGVTVRGPDPQNQNFTSGDPENFLVIRFSTYPFNRQRIRIGLSCEIFGKIVSLRFEKIGDKVWGGVVLRTCRATWRKPITPRFRAWSTLVRKKKFGGSTTPRWGDIELQIMQCSHPPPSKFPRQILIIFSALT